MENEISKTKKDFFLAGKAYGVLGVTSSLIATIFGASAILGLTDDAALNGLPAAWFLLSGAAGFAGLLLILNKIDFSNFHSISEYFGSVFGEGYRKFSALLILISWTAIIAAQFVAVGKVFSVILNLNFNYGVMLTAIIIFSYTSVGGQKGVVGTDKIQLLGIAAGLIYLLSIIDMSVIKTAFNYQDKKYLFEFPINEKFNLTNLITMLIAGGVPYLIGPDIYSRLLVADKKQTVYKSVFISIFIIIIAAFAIVLIGIYFKLIMPEIQKDFIFNFFKNQNYYIKISFALFVFCVIGSSADTCLMTSATLVTNDILKISKSGKKIIYTTRTAMIIIVSIASLIAIAKPVIIKNLLLSYKIFSISFLTPFVYNIIFELKKVKFNIWFLYAFNLISLVTFFWLEFINNKFSFIFAVILYFVLFGVYLFKIKRFNSSSAFAEK